MTTPKRLVRRPESGRIGGVCAGFAEYMDADVTLIRLVWLLVSIFLGAVIGGVIAYAIAWLLMPVAAGPMVEPAIPRRLTRSTGDRRIGGVCGGLAEYFDVDSTVVRVVVALLAVFAGAVVFGVLAYFVAWFIMPSRETQHALPAPSTA